MLGQKDIEDIDEFILARRHLPLPQNRSNHNTKGFLEQDSCSFDTLVDFLIDMHQFNLKLRILGIIFPENVGRIVAVLAEPHELGLTVANLLHSSIDGIVRRFVLLLPMSSHHIRRPLNDVDPVVGDVAVKIGNLLAGLHDGLSEAGRGRGRVYGHVLNAVDDDIDAVAAVGKHDPKTVQHLQLFLRHHEPPVLVLERHNYQKAHLLQVGRHRANVVEVDQLPKPRTVRVARHIHDRAPVLPLPPRVKVGLLGH